MKSFFADVQLLCALSSAVTMTKGLMHFYPTRRTQPLPHVCLMPQGADNQPWHHCRVLFLLQTRYFVYLVRYLLINLLITIVCGIMLRMGIAAKLNAIVTTLIYITVIKTANRFCAISSFTFTYTYLYIYIYIYHSTEHSQISIKSCSLPHWIRTKAVSNKHCQ